MTAPVTDQGVTDSGMAFFRTGSGPPLVFLPGLSPDHRLPQGRRHGFERGQLRVYAGHEVWWVQRRQGLEPGVTMADLAADYAALLRERFEGPVPVVGVSTGGSVALQLTLDHPDVVERLLLVCSAHRLGDDGRATQRRVAEHLRSHRPRNAGAATMAAMGAGPVSRRLLGATGWLLGSFVLGDGDPDLLATIAAEDGFDVGARLGEIGCPVLVVGGARDRFYSPRLLIDTAARIPGGRLVLYSGRGHLGTQMSRRFPGEVRRFLDRPARR